MLSIYDSWVASGCSGRWCAQNSIHARSMTKAREVRRQLSHTLQEHKRHHRRPYGGGAGGGIAESALDPQRVANNSHAVVGPTTSVASLTGSGSDSRREKDDPRQP